jgi:bifunctional DNA-binding transcriptional regulator/antitoxin component of YhaV-PrlF toxin-antitoxin module
MPMSNVDRYKARKTPYYASVSSRGQVTLPKPLRKACDFDAHKQLVKITSVDAGLFLEPVIAVTVKTQTSASPGENEKDPELVAAERADVDEFFKSRVRR